MDYGELARALKDRASQNAEWSEEELSKVISAIASSAPADSNVGVDVNALRAVVAKFAHLGHKQWRMTEAASAELAQVIDGPDAEGFRAIFDRVLTDGQWDAAYNAVSCRDGKPWVVLVTGLNGIRKTTSMYQPWFREVLQEALGDSYIGSPASLPDGKNSFFRQLDYMIATLASEDFRTLYNIEDIPTYSKFKDAIFARYRMLAEMLGVLLLKEGQKKGLNILVETSGRDIAMFQYIDHFFEDGGAYNKLVLHFTINDISFAERSVDRRMEREMADGKAANAAGVHTRDIIKVNAGGPYGSAVLAGVQADSERVWSEVLGGNSAGKNWYKACIAIDAVEEGEGAWSAAAVRPDGSKGKAFSFVR
jgi:hypothetical protein